MSSLHWFTVSSWSTHTPTEAFDQLAALGVRRREPDGLACYYADPATREILKEVGTITVDADQMIDVWPRHGISDDDLLALAGCAENAFRKRPSLTAAWNRHRSRTRGTWWSADTIVAVNEAIDEVGRAVARLEHRTHPSSRHRRVA